jgi:hypothetical protein
MDPCAHGGRVGDGHHGRPAQLFGAQGAWIAVAFSAMLRRRTGLSVAVI